MRLIVPPEQFTLPQGYCWCFAHQLSDGSVSVSVIAQPPSAAAGADAYLASARREIEQRARDALAAEAGQ